MCNAWCGVPGSLVIRACTRESAACVYCLVEPGAALGAASSGSLSEVQDLGVVPTTLAERVLAWMQQWQARAGVKVSHGAYKKADSRA
jgi:hypothetical protein